MPSSRREFLQSSAALAAASLAAPAVHAAGSDILKVGLIGCGGRGTGAASQALNADKNVKLTAMGDAFGDRLESSLERLKKDAAIAGKIDVKPDHCFVGFDAYKQVIDSGVDVVVLCEPPHFRPSHLKYAVEKGKHVFAEKPCAVDAPGIRSVLATCEEAKKKNLSVVSGLCLRFDAGFQETIKRIHDGALGDILTMQANDLRGGIWQKERQPDWTDMHFQMRNWYHFTWLSGDFNVEQHVHFLDICAWVMKDEYPVRCVGQGGRQVRNAPGHIYDHFAIVYEYANGQKLFSFCRQIPRCKNDISAQVMGTKGVGHLTESDGKMSLTTLGAPWFYRGKHKDMYQVEHDELFASIRAGKPINNANYMAKSSLMAIMARMTAYTGQQITWDMAFNSKEDLSPAKYEWGPLPMPEVAKPGVTKFV
ncbi:oxidoreductase [Planctomycetaceae bacterium SCGC AG-212-F19]|nr:oxidoreductase [Planctomycetaceae bacterium SCGC AG-212-F19]